MENIKGIIFDVDGTLIEWKTTILLPGVKEWFEREAKKYKISFCSNQGGVGCHYWMKEGNWGDYTTLPDEASVENTMESINTQLGGNYPWFTCYAYISTRGKPAPTPSHVTHWMQEWDLAYRKPEPTMLLLAACSLKLLPDEIMVVGDREEDHKAAQRAGMAFMWADDFFNEGEW